MPPCNGTYCPVQNVPMPDWDLILDLAKDLTPGPNAEARKKWRQRGYVPGVWLPDLMKAARARGVELDAAEIPTRVEAA